MAVTNIKAVWSGGDLLFKDADGNTVLDLGQSGVEALQKEKVEAIAVDTTLTAADTGKFFLITAADKVVTLPATALGLKFTFMVTATGLSASTGFSVSPAAADQIAGNGFTAADNKDAINTGATDAAGDKITLVGDGSAGWYISEIIGTWARET